jgi:hypothetical protein
MVKTLNKVMEAASQRRVSRVDEAMGLGNNESKVILHRRPDDASKPGGAGRSQRTSR